METNSVQQMTATGKICAKYSFVTGSGLFLFFFLTRFDPLLIIGTYYLVLALLINSVIFLLLVFTALLQPSAYRELLITAIIMLLNLPAAYLYFYLVMQIA
ncbi:hypothetical protein [Pedobacter heparinus]|uniref:Uncharacterized protein n=1 Tax=Pedobacter heparinus (strain ATCC 13125 / DSM 2366 / CIP 104194 / JCM 7457 / NBRC 12017 / NCIMB 9290 / NRRL B-14731 / HIM 762-3) TaxID=485917 RepID=C6Y2K3_PEDHD|nr:hypothetical protein [Pedobacter heparinus]ACU05213.1 hypothetical protein Phep_3015 [Pedobacter heparinus DSM 2366]